MWTLILNEIVNQNEPFIKFEAQNLNYIVGQVNQRYLDFNIPDVEKRTVCHDKTKCLD